MASNKFTANFNFECCQVKVNRKVTLGEENQDRLHCWAGKFFLARYRENVPCWHERRENQHGLWRASLNMNR
jgi:hypothetical protein